MGRIQWSFNCSRFPSCFLFCGAKNTTRIVFFDSSSVATVDKALLWTSYHWMAKAKFVSDTTSALFLDRIVVFYGDVKSTVGNAGKFSGYLLKAIVIHSWKQISNCRNDLEGHIEAVASEIIPTCVFYAGTFECFLFNLYIFFLLVSVSFPFCVFLSSTCAAFAHISMKMDFKTSECPERERSY